MSSSWKACRSHSLCAAAHKTGSGSPKIVQRSCHTGPAHISRRRLAFPIAPRPHSRSTRLKNCVFLEPGRRNCRGRCPGAGQDRRELKGREAVRFKVCGVTAWPRSLRSAGRCSCWRNSVRRPVYGVSTLPKFVPRLSDKSVESDRLWGRQAASLQASSGNPNLSKCLDTIIFNSATRAPGNIIKDVTGVAQEILDQEGV